MDNTSITVVVVAFVIGLILTLALNLYIWQFRRTQNRALGYAPYNTGGYIYCWRDSEDRRYCKIGRTKNLVGRFRAFKTAQPKPITLIAVIPVMDDVTAEKHLHQMFARERVASNNEWFRYTPRIWLYFNMVKDLNMTERTKSLI